MKEMMKIKLGWSFVCTMWFALLSLPAILLLEASVKDIVVICIALFFVLMFTGYFIDEFILK